MLSCSPCTSWRRASRSHRRRQRYLTGHGKSGPSDLFHRGNEFSAVLGFTYNFENNHTDYQKGVDMHLDWGVSKFLTKQWRVGLAGYVYQQISADHGSGDRVGSFESRVIGVGPQLSYVFPIDNKYQGNLNLKGYKEFDADHRAEGWNVWLIFTISPAPPKQP
jgi:hypothetical protein